MILNASGQDLPIYSGSRRVVLSFGGYCAIKGTLVERHHRMPLLVPRKEMPRLRLRGTF